MSTEYINIYNNLVQLSRNKDLYIEFTTNDQFSDRLLILLLHFAFFLKNIKENEDKQKAQKIHDTFFKQLELNLREYGHGDVNVNKNMKIYINNFFNILNQIVSWDMLSYKDKESIISSSLSVKSKVDKLVDYFERYRNYIKKTSLNLFLKGVIKHKF